MSSVSIYCVFYFRESCSLHIVGKMEFSRDFYLKKKNGPVLNEALDQKDTGKE